MRSKKEKFNAKIPGPDQTRYLQFQTQQSYAKRKKEKATPHQNTSNTKPHVPANKGQESDFEKRVHELSTVNRFVRCV